MSSDVYPRCWLAAYTRSRHEKQVAEQLAVKGVESLLPLYRRFNRWSDRIQPVRTPLFPGYVFVHASKPERLLVLQTAGVIQIVSFAGGPLPLSDDDVARLKSCQCRPGEIEPHPYLKIGQRVRVKDGPFSGWEGILLRKQNAARLVISLDPIMKSVAINLHGADVDPIA